MPELATSDREIILFYNPDRAGAEKIMGYPIFICGNLAIFVETPSDLLRL